MTASQSVFALAAILIPLAVALLTYLMHGTVALASKQLKQAMGLMVFCVILIWAAIILACLQMQNTSEGVVAVIILSMVGVIAPITGWWYSNLLVEGLLFRMHLAAVADE